MIDRANFERIKRRIKILAALRFNPSRWRSFVRRHPALLICAVAMAPVVILDRMMNLHALSMVLAICIALNVADAWDEETQR